MMILNEHANDFKYTVHGLNDDLFIRSKVPMTKQEVRSVSISKLMPKVTDNIYDIGAGTGSCSIELALQAQAGRVWAFERNPLALELLEKTKRYLLLIIWILLPEKLRNKLLICLLLTAYLLAAAVVIYAKCLILFIQRILTAGLL